MDELLPNEDKIIRKVAPEQLEPLRSRGSPSRNLGLKVWVSKLALKNVLNVLNDTIGQRHDG